MNELEVENSLILIPQQSDIFFPKIVNVAFINDSKMISSIKALLETGLNRCVFISQKQDKELKTYNKNNLYDVGCMVEIIQVVEFADGGINVVCKGLGAVKITKIINELSAGLPYLACQYNELVCLDHDAVDDVYEIRSNLLEILANYIANSKKITDDFVNSLDAIHDLEEIIYIIASNLLFTLVNKQALLSKESLIDKIAHLNSLLEVDLDLIEVEKRIRDRVKQQMEKNQKDYYLNEQLKAINKELKQGDDAHNEIAEFKKKAKKLKLTKEAREKVEAEIKKLELMNPISSEATVVRNYISWILDIPWGFKTARSIDLEDAESYLNADHYSLNKIKDRILEYLAVLKRSSKVRAPILCLVGPPGVGKTSLAKSIAKAAGREFVRISLGGVKDESEIRGHRRTYIGAMPGKIIQGMKKAKVNNPLFLLDEIDKMSSDFRGDPASALLEVLDKEQNDTFVDHYLEVGYDLSNIMFVATANSYNMHEALLDRVEIIELSGYSEEEKLEIAKLHLFPKVLIEYDCSSDEIEITDNAFLHLIRYYTRESGVRKLEELIAGVVRKVLKYFVINDTNWIKIDEYNLSKYAGVAKFIDSILDEKHQVGVVNGLAWTSVGGQVLLVEALSLNGKEGLKITGKIGEVMQESAKASYSLIKSYIGQFELHEEMIKNKEIHIHVPEGAVPKDGPSAGITLATAIYSVLTNKLIRQDIAMTGEITLRGKVLPIGGVREKILAALRRGIHTIILPEGNSKDLADLPANLLKQVHVITVTSFEEVLNNAIIKDK